jgi:hypothetical protein
MHTRGTNGRGPLKPRDKIVEEVRAARETYAAQFDYDLDSMFQDLKKHEVQNPALLADLKPLKPHQQQR